MERTRPVATAGPPLLTHSPVQSSLTLQREAERADMRREYERAMAQRKQEEKARRAALAREREERRLAFAEKQRAKQALAEEARLKELRDVEERHAATRRRLAEQERERMEK